MLNDTLDWLSNLSLWLLFPATAGLIVSGAEFGNWMGRRLRRLERDPADISTLAGAALGLLALLLAFSFSIAIGRFEVRRAMVVEEANAIGSTVNFALMLSDPPRQDMLGLLRDYTKVRLELGGQQDKDVFARDVARSLDLQTRMWGLATEASNAVPQSLAVNRFIGSLNEVNNVHEKRITELLYTVPVEIILMLLGVSMVALGFTGYNSGALGAKRRAADLIMSLTVALLVMLVIDLDRPTRGLIMVPIRPLQDVLETFPSQ